MHEGHRCLLERNGMRRFFLLPCHTNGSSDDRKDTADVGVSRRTLYAQRQRKKTDASSQTFAMEMFSDRNFRSIHDVLQFLDSDSSIDNFEPRFSLLGKLGSDGVSSVRSLFEELPRKLFHAG